MASRHSTENSNAAELAHQSHTIDDHNDGLSWRRRREAKLEAQRPANVSMLFSNLSFYLNGRTGDLSHHELKRLLQQHGAKVTIGPSVCPAPLLFEFVSATAHTLFV